MRKIYILPLLLIFTMCTGPKIEYKDDSHSLDEASLEKFLNTVNAKDPCYSVLFFTNGFLSQEKIEVKNNDEIVFSDTLATDRSFGLAKTLRIKNQHDIVITDLKTKYSFTLPARKNSKYKFIYVSKDADSSTDYVVTYSNTYGGFY